MPKCKMCGSWFFHTKKRGIIFRHDMCDRCHYCLQKFGETNEN